MVMTGRDIVRLFESGMRNRYRDRMKRERGGEREIQRRGREK